MSIGKQIKDLRNNRGLTQMQLAERANISRSYLADLESDRYNPSVDTLKAIAKVLNIDVSELLAEESNSKISSDNVDMDDIQFALYGEVKELSYEDKKKILDFARFVKEQNNKK